MNHTEIVCNARGIDMQCNAEVFGSPSLTLDMTVGEHTSSANVIGDEQVTCVSVVRGGVILFIDIETAKEISDAMYHMGLEEQTKGAA